MIKSILLTIVQDSMKANFIVNELNNRGIYAFINNEHTTDIIPYASNGYMIHVEMDKFEDANVFLEEIKDRDIAEPDFKEADKQDIEYEKLKTERKAMIAKSQRIFLWIVFAIATALLIRYCTTGALDF